MSKAHCGVVVAIVFASMAFIAVCIVIYKTPVSDDIEIVEARFAQVMFCGIITVFIFSAVWYVFYPDGPGSRCLIRP